MPDQPITFVSSAKASCQYSTSLTVNINLNPGDNFAVYIGGYSGDVSVSGPPYEYYIDYWLDDGFMSFPCYSGGTNATFMYADSDAPHCGAGVNVYRDYQHTTSYLRATFVKESATYPFWTPYSIPSAAMIVVKYANMNVRAPYGTEGRWDGVNSGLGTSFMGGRKHQQAIFGTHTFAGIPVVSKAPFYFDNGWTAIPSQANIREVVQVGGAGNRITVVAMDDLSENLTNQSLSAALNYTPTNARGAQMDICTVGQPCVSTGQGGVFIG